MINVETSRPVYSNAIGDKLKRSPEKKAQSQANKAVRVEKRSGRKAKRNAKRLIRMEKLGKKKFFYPLTKILGKKKKYKDGSSIEVPAANTVVVTTKDGKTASLDKTEIAKALNIPESEVTPAKVQEVVVNVPPSSAVVAAQETGTPSGEPVIAIEVKDADVTIADDGSAYLSDDTQSEDEKIKDVADDDKAKQKKIKIGRILLISGAVIVVLGAVVYFMNRNSKGTKSKK
jgi:hypothetical protein